MFIWEAQFTTQPEHLEDCTKIVCIHPHHTTREFYLTGDQWRKYLYPLLTPYWVNGYTITMIPCVC
jgi:hypothetical protein